MSEIAGEATSCPECTISFRQVAVLGDSGDPSSIREDAAGRGCMVGQLSTGEFVVSGLVGGGALHRYGPEGGPALQRFGRPGEGPGEMGRNLRVWVGEGDSLHVLDDDQARMQILDREGAYHRSYQVPARFRSFARVDDGHTVFHRTPASPTDPLFFVTDRSGNQVASFGTSTRAVDELDLETWVLAPRREGGFWAASIWRYELHAMELDGSRSLSVRRSVHWFPPDQAYPEGIFDTEPPPPGLDHVWEDTAGRLWVYTLVPDPDWTPGRPIRPSPDWYRQTFDTVVEVLDIERSEVLARVHYDGRLGMVCGTPLVYTVHETPEGDTRMEVLLPVLGDG